jgi:medium-chain acyl-[acyl-carrier-protein] hydrolase
MWFGLILKQTLKDFQHILILKFKKHNSMPISPNFTSILSKDFEINFIQCAPNGFLKYTELCNLMQVTAAAHSELGGISFSDMQVFDQAWVLSRMRVEVTKLPKWKDTITIKTWIVSLENSRSIRAMQVFLNNEKISTSETFWAVMNTKTRRPEALAIAHEHFEKYAGHFATEKQVSKIEFDVQASLVNSRKVVFSDLDIVNHVNSMKYLEWCLDCLDSELLLDKKIIYFDLNYMKELSIDDFVEIRNEYIDKEIIFSVLKEEKACFALKLYCN